jgi:hypothetical protein
MIPASFVHLRPLHEDACVALSRTGSAFPLRTPTTPRELQAAAQQASIELVTALSIAGRARVFRQVEAVIRPAQDALARLLDGCREELETRRAS